MLGPMTAPDWRQSLRADLDRLREAHLYRSRRTVLPLDATHVEIDGRRYVNFASNDYLGLTHHPAVIEAAANATRRYGAGSGAAPLVSGYTPAHASCESALARWKGAEAAILFPSGYQANAAAVQTLLVVGERKGGGVRFLLDKLCHASLIDAVRGTGAPFRVFPHNHLAKLERLLDEADPGQLQVVVTESIFSMDGDAADLAGLAELKGRRPFLLLLDEAHGTGVYGPDGRGYAAECGLQEVVDVTVVTLSKGLGCAGGAVCAEIEFCEAVVNYARPYLFSTSLPAGVVAGAEAAIGVMQSEPQRQFRLRERARQVRAALREAGRDLPAGDSPIIPVVFGSEEAALGAAERLREEGFLAPAIRPPTVPKGMSRVRITLSSEHTDEEIERLLRVLLTL
jgi:8-amino-7-oxononanoate synthase